VWVFKLSANGDSLWSTTIGGADFESCSSIQQLADGSYLLAGGTQSFGSGMYDFYLIKMEPEALEPPLVANPPELDFGVRPTGVEHDLSVFIRNTTTMPIALVEAITELEAFSVVDFTSGDLAPGDSTEITVRFYPTSSFDYHDTLIVVTPLSSFLMQVPLHGVGAAFHIYIPYTALIMGASPGQRDSVTLPLINDGEMDAIIDTVYFTAHGDVFSVSPLAAVLPAGTQQEFEVIFDPVMITTYNSNLCFVHNVAPDSEICIPVIGEIRTPNVDDQVEGIPSEYYLAEAYPNPFNPSTTIEFGLPQESQVKLSVFDLTGRVVETIVQQQLPAGRHSVEFSGQQLPSGIYFYTITAGSFSAGHKMILLK
ncbi:T9SS type A sorting domain-containing protein, partial [bacterium]|nr:T9SS type A sorting domain-containing protein [bacterium]